MTHRLAKICPLLPFALILLLSLASCNLCERKIPAIRQHDHSVKAVTELPEDYGRLNPDRDFGDADSSAVSFLIDSRDGSFARGYSNDEFRVVFEWHDGNGRLIASGTRYVGAKTYEYGGWYDFRTYEYDEDGRETLSRAYERTKGTKVMRLSREHRSVYGDGGLSKKKHTVIYWLDTEKHCVRKREFVDDDAALYEYHPNGKLKDIEAGDLRATCDKNGNYLTYWHFEGGEWIFKNHYDRKDRLTKQVARSLDRKDRRTWTYEYDGKGNLVRKTFPDWLWTFGGETAYFYGSDGTLRYTKTKGGRGMLGDPPEDATPEKYLISVEYHSNPPPRTRADFERILRETAEESTPAL